MNNSTPAHWGNSACGYFFSCFQNLLSLFIAVWWMVRNLIFALHALFVAFVSSFWMFCSNRTCIPLDYCSICQILLGKQALQITIVKSNWIICKFNHFNQTLNSKNVLAYGMENSAWKFLLSHSPLHSRFCQCQGILFLKFIWIINLQFRGAWQCDSVWFFTEYFNIGSFLILTYI